MRQKQSAAIGARGWNKVIHMVTCPLLSFQFYSRSVIVCWHVSLSSEACLSCPFLSICLSICLCKLEYMWTFQFASLFISLSLSTYSTYQSIYLSAYISIYENICLSVRPYVCFSKSICLYLSICLCFNLFRSIEPTQLPSLPNSQITLTPPTPPSSRPHQPFLLLRPRPSPGTTDLVTFSFLRDYDSFKRQDSRATIGRAQPRAHKSIEMRRFPTSCEPS